MTLFGVLRRMQPLIIRLIGQCPACKTRFPQTQTTRRLRIMTKSY